MAESSVWPPTLDLHAIDRSQFGDRPLPLRTYSESEASETPNPLNNNASHLRRKSAQSRLRIKAPPSSVEVKSRMENLPPVPELRENSLSPRQLRPGSSKLLTPPVTPQRPQSSKDSSPPVQPSQDTDVLPFDFSKIDYELDRARSIGQGLWSSVYLAQPLLKSPRQSRRDILTPPLSPPQPADLPPCSVFAIKQALRPDAKSIFLQEARIITTLQRSREAHQYVVQFFGLDERSHSLVFEGVIGGSLESLTQRLKVMTELERHLELRSLFGKISSDLIAGLHFIHSAGIVHADIKPANILLDITDHDPGSLAIRARYIDFSASFVVSQDGASNAGGTWDFMAPEQMRIQKDLNTPTFASDVWSLGITLLFIIVGGSPYRAACGDNVFMLREAIKTADPLGFARMDPVVQKRMATCQDFIDCCRLSLQKDRVRRSTAAAWTRWMESEGIS